MLNKNIPRAVVGKVILKAHSLRYLTDYPPVVTGLARRINHCALAGNTPLGIGDSAILLAPAGGWQQNICRGAGICFGNTVGYDHGFTELQCRRDLICIGQADDWVGAHNPNSLNTTIGDCIK